VVPTESHLADGPHPILWNNLSPFLKGGRWGNIITKNMFGKNFLQDFLSPWGTSFLPTLFAISGLMGFLT
jgi:hypothetical protein